jgi:hypothetical protein
MVTLPELPRCQQGCTNACQQHSLAPLRRLGRRCVVAEPGLIRDGDGVVRIAPPLALPAWIKFTLAKLNLFTFPYL